MLPTLLGRKNYEEAMSDEHSQLNAFLASNQKTKRGASIFIKGTCQLN